MRHIPYGMALSNFNMLPRQSLHFWVKVLDLNQLPSAFKADALPIELTYVTYHDVLPQLLRNLLDYKIQHTTYRLPCELLNGPSGSCFLQLPLYCELPLCANTQTNLTIY